MFKTTTNAILEATAVIPKIQGQLEQVLTWEENVSLIPVIFEEVGALRKEVNVMKEAMKLLDRHDERLAQLDQRLTVVEQKVR